MMTDQEQRIAIAEACKWRREYIFGNGVDDYVWIHPTNGKVYPDMLCYLPDYLNDLNSIHEAEMILYKGLIDQDYWQKGYGRFQTILSESVVLPFSATARQRAEAFLKTLGLWKDNI